MAKRKAAKRGGPKPEAGTRTAGKNLGPGLADPEELRGRWQRTREIIRDAVGHEDDHDPRIWERGVYQLWLWLVVELLVVRRDDIDVKDLSVISKMLHEQRKLSLDEIKQLQKDNDGGNGASGSFQLPEHFGSLVRQIYGTNFQDDTAAPDDEASSRPSSQADGERSRPV